jgi:hypothetical protein
MVRRVQAWLRDAAADRLIRREDGFEETRIPEVLGYCIYEPSDLRKWVYQQWRQNGRSAGFAILWYELLKNPRKEPLVGTDTYAIRLVSPLREDLIALPRELSMRINQLLNELGTEKDSLEKKLFGILAWPSRRDICHHYLAELPDTLARLQEWATSMGIPLSAALQSYLSHGLQLFGGVPITLVIPRPQKLIRSRSFLEILNFVVIAHGNHQSEDGKWNPDTTVLSMGHRTPLTLSRAREISSQSLDFDLGRLLFLGCGAVGSKLILHLTRSGQGKSSHRITWFAMAFCMTA